MGIVKPEEQAYYATGGDHGSYQYLSLVDITNSFRAAYVGHDKICDGVTDSDISFHAIRAMQELSYDTLKCVNSWEIEVPSSLHENTLCIGTLGISDCPATATISSA